MPVTPLERAAPQPSTSRPPAGPAGVLRPGASGDDVLALQRALGANGFRVALDGRFGPATERAVRQFQRAQGLDVDGVAGPRTQARLGAAQGRALADDFGPPRPAPPADALRQTRGGAVRVRADVTGAALRALGPEHARLADELAMQGFFPVRMADGGFVFMSTPGYEADATGRGVSNREAREYARAHGLRLPTRAEAEAFRAQAPVVVQFEPGPRPGTPAARTAVEQQARIAARLREAGVPERGVAIAGATKVWALDPGAQRPGLTGAVTDVVSGAALQGYSTVHGPDYEDYSQAAQFVHPVRVAPTGAIAR
ncbi:MAG: peptidoglycan-binding protein [Myxococcaceae bacterium]|jgi:peptidoglycan hydrolase-like protein with peptidoglycan-binding domain|nr:peptidoglycan-binding protein [Myxococcaceae bacterium]MCA3012075.1 peptidoglycan-binding protein [Myxococcaceae bacterium]